MSIKLTNQEIEKISWEDLECGEKQQNSWKMRNAYCRTWNLERKQINVENETQTLHDLEYGEETEKRGK